MNIYRCLVAHFGPRNWWPAKSSFEVIVGAILAQAVAWRNVEIAITRLEQEGLLSPRAIRELPLEELADYIRSSRYYRMKAKKLKAFMEFFHERYHDSLAELFAQPVDKLRRELLGVYGLGGDSGFDSPVRRGPAGLCCGCLYPQSLSSIGLLGPECYLHRDAKIFPTPFALGRAFVQRLPCPNCGPGSFLLPRKAPLRPMPAG